MDGHGHTSERYPYTVKPVVDGDRNLLLSRAAICKQLSDLKDSIDLAHHNNRVTQTQVGGCIKDIKDNSADLASLNKNYQILNPTLESWRTTVLL